MKDNHSTASRSPISNPLPYTGSDRFEGHDDLLADEPLASGQRKRYLASLCHAASLG